MGSLIDIERAFHTLQQRLSRNASERHSLMALIDFVRRLEPPYDRYEPYLLELQDQLPKLRYITPLTGMDPDRLYPMYETLSEIGRQRPEVGNQSPFSSWMKRLRRVLMLLYGFTGDFDVVCSLLPNHGESVKRVLDEMEWRSGESPYDFMNRWVERCRSTDRPGIEELQSVLEEWSRCRHYQRNGLFVPVVEESEQEDAADSTEGRLRTLRINLYSKLDQDHDLLRPVMPISDTSQPVDEVFRIPLSAVRELLQRTGSSRTGGPIQGEVSYELVGPPHRGRSIDLAVAGLAYAQVIDQAETRERFAFQPATAVTGELTHEGEVQPVQREGLKAKVRAVFFSPVEQFVVPESQSETVRRHVHMLQRRYPHRQLTVIGAQHLQDLFLHRQITARQMDGRLRLAGRWLWHRKRSTGMFILLLALAGLWWGSLDSAVLSQNPTSVRQQGQYLEVLNAYDNTIDRVRVTDNPDWYRGIVQRKDHNVFADLHDITADGYRDACWMEFYGNPKPDSSAVTCRDLRGDSLLWQKTLDSRVEYPRQSFNLSNSFIGREIRIFSPGSRSRPRVAVMKAHETFFPGMIQLFDAESGTLSGQYLHPGHLVDLEITDLDRNTRKELVAVGVNNSTNGAVVLALDPATLQGYGPGTIEYQPADARQAAEIAYWQVPLTAVARVNIDRQSSNVAKQVFVRSEQLKIRIKERIKDRTNGLANIEDPYYFAYFDNAFRWTGMGTSDSYDRAVRQLMDRGYLQSKPGSAHFEQLADSVRYWNGRRWTRSPTITENYRRLRNSLKKPAYELLMD